MPPSAPIHTIKMGAKMFGDRYNMTNFENCDNVQGAPENVPYIVHESFMARMERHIKRLWIALIISIAMLFTSGAIFTYAWLQYDYSSEETVTVDGKDGIANYIGNDGDIVNGENHGCEAEEANP